MVYIIHTLSVLQTEFFNNYLRDLDRPGQQETAVGAPSSASGSPAGIVHLEERQPISPGGQSTPGGWGQPPQMMFARGVYIILCVGWMPNCRNIAYM